MKMPTKKEINKSVDEIFREYWPEICEYQGDFKIDRKELPEWSCVERLIPSPLIYFIPAEIKANRIEKSVLHHINLEINNRLDKIKTNFKKMKKQNTGRE